MHLEIDILTSFELFAEMIKGSCSYNLFVGTFSIEMVASAAIRCFSLQLERKGA